jgi:hypothetical protein
MVDKVVKCDIVIKLLMVFMLIVIAYELNPELTQKTVTFFNNLFEKIREYTEKASETPSEGSK